MSFLDQLPEAVPPKLPDNLEPENHQRVWYRHRRNGNRGYMVRRDGRECIKLDRPAEDITKPYQQGEWIQEADRRPMTEATMAQVALAADRQLCLFLGEHELSRKDWHSMSDDERIGWMQEGPDDPEIRAVIYEVIMEVLRSHGVQG
jgi:hypothetical protein